MPERLPERIWNSRRQWMGNLVPIGVALLVALPLFRLGVIAQVIVGILVGAIGVNKWGFFENSKIEQELQMKTAAEGELIGFVYRMPPTILDAHAEIGFLKIRKDKLEIVSEDETIVFSQDEIAKFSRRNNIHSLLRLGCWVVIELIDGTEFKFESRGYPTMWASTWRSEVLYEKLQTWKRKKPPHSEGSHVVSSI